MLRSKYGKKIQRKFLKEIIHETFPEILSSQISQLYPALWMKIDSPRHIIVQFHYTGNKERILNVSQEKKKIYMKDQKS